MEEYFEILSRCPLFSGIAREEMQAKQRGQAEFVIPYDRQAPADYLGVERSAMSAEIGKLKKQGILDTHGSRFRVLKQG